MPVPPAALRGKEQAYDIVPPWGRTSALASGSPGAAKSSHRDTVIRAGLVSVARTVNLPSPDASKSHGFRARCQNTQSAPMSSTLVSPPVVSVAERGRETGEAFASRTLGVMLHHIFKTVTLWRPLARTDSSGVHT